MQGTYFIGYYKSRASDYLTEYGRANTVKRAREIAAKGTYDNPGITFVIEKGNRTIATIHNKYGYADYHVWAVNPDKYDITHYVLNPDGSLGQTLKNKYGRYFDYKKPRARKSRKKSDVTDGLLPGYTGKIL